MKEVTAATRMDVDVCGSKSSSGWCVYVCMRACVCLFVRWYGCVCFVILVRIVVSIPACHAGDPGSIPGREVLLFSFAPTVPCLRFVA